MKLIEDLEKLYWDEMGLSVNDAAEFAISILKELKNNIQDLRQDCEIVGDYSDSEYIEWEKCKDGDYLDYEKIEYRINQKIKEINEYLREI